MTPISPATPRSPLQELIAELVRVVPRQAESPPEARTVLVKVADATLARVALLLERLNQQPPDSDESARLSSRLLLLEVSAATAGLRQLTTLVRTDVMTALTAIAEAAAPPPTRD